MSGLFFCGADKKIRGDSIMKQICFKKFSRVRRVPAGLFLLLFAGLAGGCSLFSHSLESAVSGDDLESLAASREQMELLEADYASEGFIPEEDAPAVLSAVAGYAEELKQEGILQNYSLSGSHVWMLYDSGIQMIYTPDTGITDAVGLDSTCRIVTCQPYASSYPPSLSEEMGLPDSAASSLEQLSASWTFEDNYDMEEVTPDLLKELNGTQILLWHGHGGWTEETHSFLATGETFSENRFQNDIDYYEDFQTGRLVLCSDGRVAVTAGFVREYMDALDGSLIYLGACQSGLDAELSDAFLEKGAAAVIANTDTIRTAYNTRMMYSTMEGLSLTDASSGQRYTLEQALQYAASVWGESDSVQFGGTGARPVYFGENIRLDETPVENPVPEETLPGTQDTSTLLQEYAEGLDCLSGSGTYTGYFEITGSGPRYNYWSSLPVRPLSRLQMDFDQDGADELLVVNLNTDYTLRAEMYEAEGGEIQLISSTSLPASAASISEEGYLDCMTYQYNGQTAIGFEERSLASHLADGTLIRFTALLYDGASLQMLGTQEYMGSGGLPEEGEPFVDGMASMGIYVDFEQIFYEGTSIFSYLDSPEAFASSRTYCLWEDEAWLAFYPEWYSDPDAGPVEASIIEFQ